MLLSKIYVIKQKMQSEQIFDVVEHFYHSLNVRSVLTFMNVYEWEDLEEFFRILETMAKPHFYTTVSICHMIQWYQDWLIFVAFIISCKGLW